MILEDAVVNEDVDMDDIDTSGLQKKFYIKCLSENLYQINFSKVRLCENTNEISIILPCDGIVVVMIFTSIVDIFIDVGIFYIIFYHSR